MRNPSLDIDLDALGANYRRFQGGGAEIAAVVKCDAYGLGAPRVAQRLYDREGCRTFFVAYSEEGAELRQGLGGRDADIVVFNGPFAETISLYRAHRLIPTINTLEQASLWANSAPGAPAALHVDTGMNRLGLAGADIGVAAAIPSLVIALVMSHLACASETDHPMTERQRRQFEAAAQSFPKARRSLSASGGALMGERFAFDLVRAGVGLYGVGPQDAPDASLATVATLSAPVLQVRRAAAGETVGYGASQTLARDSRLAAVSLGYGDGYPRAASGRGHAVLNGALCPIIGRVSMDLIVLDATDAPVPAIGDRAEFFGPRLPIEAAAAAAGTIGYELLTGVGGLARPRPGLGGRVVRRYVEAHGRDGAARET